MDTHANTDRLKQAIKGKTVAIVGPAHSIIGTGQGELIDSHDIVIRFSHAVHIQHPPEDAGLKTDWIIVNGCVRRYIETHNLKPTAKIASISRDIVRDFLYFRPHLDLETERTYRVIPLLGTPTIKFAHDAGSQSIYIAGFDFFRTADSLCNTTRGEALNFRPHSDGSNLCHLAERDERWTRDFLKNKPNIKCDTTLSKILSTT